MGESLFPLYNGFLEIIDIGRDGAHQMARSRSLYHDERKCRVEVGVRSLSTIEKEMCGISRRGRICSDFFIKKRDVSTAKNAVKRRDGIYGPYKNRFTPTD